MPAVLVDLDGTVCDTAHRAHMVKGPNPDWVAYSLACNNDRPVAGVIELVRALERAGWDIIILSGRSDRARERTRAWLYRHKVPFDGLFLRRVGDERTNVEMKAAKVETMRDDEWDIQLAIDDYQPVAERFVSMGIQCVLVARDGRQPQYKGPGK